MATQGRILSPWVDHRCCLQIPVMDSGWLLGMVTRDRVLAFIRTRAELGLGSQGVDAEVGIPGQQTRLRCRSAEPSA